MIQTAFNKLIFNTALSLISEQMTKMGRVNTYFQQAIESLHNSELNENIESNTIAFIIDDNADILEDGIWTDTLIENLIDEGQEHWNTTLVEALKDYSDLYLNNNFQLSGIWNLDDLRNADAGASFVYDNVNRLVIPWVNIENKSYKEVRTNKQIIKAVVESPRFLQFTKSQEHPWIRLLMPMNPRRVEVEDLDRNFWVIGQGISIICSFLFDDDSPLKYLFKEILGEITEQWENMLYLWLNYEIMSSRSSHICLIEDLPNDLFCTRKFDNFDTEDWTKNGSEIIEDSNKKRLLLTSHFNYLTKKYNNSYISLLVRVRDNNYYQNWYLREGYPFYGFYDGMKWNWYRLEYTTNDTSIIKYFFFNPSSGYDNVLYGYTIDGTTWKYGAYNNINKIAGLRIVPEIECGGTDTVDLRFKVYDAVEYMIKEATEVPVLKYYYSGDVMTDPINPNNNVVKIIKDNSTYTREHTYPSPTTEHTKTIDDIKTPIYLGEIPSKYYHFGGGN